MTEESKIRKNSEDSDNDKKIVLDVRSGAVQIFRPYKNQVINLNPQKIKQKKMPHTNIAKLIYVAPTPKNTPTKSKVKRIHHYVNKNPRRMLFKENYEDENKISTNRPNSKTHKIVSNEQILKKNLGGDTCVERLKDTSEKIIAKCLRQPEELALPTEINNKSKDKLENKTFKNKDLNIKSMNGDPQLDEQINSKILSKKLECKKNLSVNYIDTSKLTLTNIEHKTSENSAKDIIEKDNINVNSSPKKSLTTFRSSELSANLKDIPEIKKKFYNSDETKQFIKKQREKWKADEKTNLLNKNKPNKEEIKKRLEELHKNTLKILETNLKKAKKRNAAQSTKILDKSESPPKTRKFTKVGSARTVNLTQKLNERENIKQFHFNLQTSGMQCSNATTSEFDSQKRIGLLRKADSDEISFSTVKDYDIIKENEKLQSLVASKINLTDFAIASNKESESDLNSGIKIVETREISQNNIETAVEFKRNANSNLKLHLKSDIEQLKTNNIINNVKDMEIQTSLQIPNLKLESKTLQDKFEKSVQVQMSHENKENVTFEKTKNKSGEIPYWLKPSAVEIYPYNFITAVRKKLEALTNPVVQRPLAYERKKKTHRNLNIHQETPLSHIKSTNENVRRRIIESDSLKKLNSKSSYSKVHNTDASNLKHGVNANIIEDSVKKNSEKSISISEIVSNFSSVSLHVPESNTTSDISSLKSDLPLSKMPEKQFLNSTKNHDISSNEHSANDNTTISSSVFSSPEKMSSIVKNREVKEADNSFLEKSKSISPLSLENITNLQVKSKNMKTKHFVEENLSIPNIKLNRNSKSEQENNHENTIKRQNKFLELDQLLVDFNKSLSQVIEVNNQLKSTLDKSQKPKLFSPNSKRDCKMKEIDTILLKPSVTSCTNASDYTSDFEDDASNVTITSAQPEKEESILNSISAQESNITLEQSKQSQEFNKQRRSVENINNLGSTLKADSVLSNEPILKSPVTENTTQSTITEDIAGIAIEENVQSIIENADIQIRTEIQNKNNKFKKDSNSKIDFVETHVNTIRGNDDYTNIHTHRSDAPTNIKNSTVSEQSSAPPVYSIERKQNQFINSSVGSEFISFYNKSDVEISMFLQDDNKSETTLNYSSIGVYDQLLQAENLKSEQLTALLKMREKVLIDRTKGQIAWLEIQKEKYKSKGLFEQITIIKKKQRGILMKMEKEREEIKKLMSSQANASSTHSARIKNQHHSTVLKTFRSKLSDNISNITVRKGISTTISKTQSGAKIVRGFDLGTSQNLEKILQKREEELKNRRQHVEHLIAWHQRLDKEEHEVFHLEQILLECNNCNNWQILSQKIDEIGRPITSEQELKKDKKIAEIERSLKELQNISVCSKENPDAIDHVRISGHKLNKLWSRLTGQKMNKFDAHKKYKLTKEDLEKFYEKAKEKVIEEFNKDHNLNKLLEQSSNDKISIIDIVDNINDQNDHDIISVHSVDVPSLHLNFTSESDVQHTLNSPSIQSTKNEEGNTSKSKSENSFSARENVEFTGTSNESLNTHSEKHLSYELSEKNKVISVNENMLEEFEVNKNSFKNSQNSSVEGSPTIKTDILYNRDLKTDDEYISEKNLTEILSETDEKVFTSIIPFDQTFNVNSNSPDVQTSLEEQISSQESIMGSNQVTEHIKESRVSNHSEIIRPSVIVSLTSSFSIDLSKNLKKKAELKMRTAECELNEKYATSASSINSNSKLLKSINQSPENSTECTSNSTNNSTKPPSSISLENMYNDQSNSMNSSIVLELISPSIDRQTVISKNLTLEKKQTTSDNSNTGIFDKSSEYNYEYENDFSESDFTNLEDISMPKFETTLETTKVSLLSEDLKSENYSERSQSNEKENWAVTSVGATELEKRLIDLDGSLKDLNNTIEKVLSPEKEKSSNFKKLCSSTASATMSPIPVTTATLPAMKTQTAVQNTLVSQQNNSHSAIITNSANDIDKITLMPDIISEVEIRRRQQILIESEIKQLEHAMPYVVFREIPNKPPPPYVPPAHGSPMTTIFPSESRIKEITFRRTAEIFEELSKKNDKASEKTNNKNSILNEQITNIYERIILDICKECMQEYEETLNNLNPESYKNPLALYNPPDRLNCMQEFIYQRVRKLLAMEKNFQRKNSIFSIGRKKRDHVDEILIQELFEEEYKWTNFDQEEDEVKTSIVEEILNGVIKDVVIEAVNRNKGIDDDDATNLDIEIDNTVQEESKSLNDA